MQAQHSPGYPENYDFQLDAMEVGCYYRLAAKRGYYIKLMFEDIVMEDDRGAIEIYRRWDGTKGNKLLS